MSELIQHADGLWSASAPHRFLGLHLGTRMTVLRLPGGGLWLDSVVAVDDLLADQIQALGPVAHIVVPNLYHHVYVSDAIERWPTARVHAPAAMRRKRPGLRIDAELSETPDPDWGGVLVPVHVDGSMLDETVFVHRPSRTLICSDLVENFDTSPHLPTRLYLRAAGLHGRVGWSRFLRLVYRDRPATRRSLERLLGLDFDRVILAHGRVLEHGGPAAVREGYRWLGPATATAG
ncbi:MAG TPA: DUF4336 domain-containing protein [Myxococcaceae bacterium]|nr:DUF4336 domain-containing protein [Myxococcaceae bacterium]